MMKIKQINGGYFHKNIINPNERTFEIIINSFGLITFNKLHNVILVLK